MAHAPGPARPRQFFLYGLAAIVALLLVVIVVAPLLNVSRFRRGIAQSISQGVGRPVHVGSVSFQVLPQPAFVLSDVSIAEDGHFGVEPMMTADTVTATLRASTLWHRRVEVATLSFQDPSLNLVRNADGQWDFDSILQRASIPQATRAQQFPYVEATGARINFKFGNEKQPFSLMDADVALWKESVGQWHMRIKAQPVRTDLELSDTGEVRGEATLQYAKVSGSAPLTVHAEWRKVQLGDISRLLHGHDTGWRGAVDLTADATGTLAAVDLVTRAQVEDFRRVEFVPPSEMDWDVTCKAHYERSVALFSPIACDAPLDTGTMHVAGAFSLSPPQQDRPDVSNVQMTLRQVPANFILSLLRHVHSGLPAQVSGSGLLNGELNCETALDLSSDPCTGTFHAARWTLHLPDVAEPLDFSALDIVHAVGTPQNATMTVRASHKKAALADTRTPTGNFILQPVHVALGAPLPAAITGTFSRKGYRILLNGSATLDAIGPITHALGTDAFPAGVAAAHGNAQLALILQGSWLPTSSTPTAAGTHSHSWTGSVQLLDARIALQDFPGRIQLSKATLQLAPETITGDDIRGSYQKVNFDGNFQYATITATDNIPERVFHLHIENLNAGYLESGLLAAGAQSSTVLATLARWTGNTPTLPRLTGDIQIDNLTAGILSLKNASFLLEMEGQKAEASQLAGETLGGTFGGSATLDWSTGYPRYHGKFDLHAIQPNAVATLFKVNPWGHGPVDIHLDWKTNGFTAKEMARQTTGTYTAIWKSGGWDNPELAKTPLARFDRLALQGSIANQNIQIRSGIVSNVPRTVSLTGSVSFAGGLHLNTQPFLLQINGTLAHPILKTPNRVGTPQGNK